MAAASDKARFYLEQSVPELRELERKKIFTKDEITSIAKKRSDFEHKLNARGSHPSDYARYAEYEMNLETLRLKRAKRMGVKATQHTGQRRIMFILDRATRKFHGDLGLWMQYLDYARKQKASNKILQLLTDLVRLHPTKPQVWIYAAAYAMEERGDMTEARSYFQRGLRFCKQSKELWLEYARLELIYIAKISARQKILGLDHDFASDHVPAASDNPDTDLIMLPAITAEDINPSARTDNEIGPDGLRTLSETPALSGVIPITIYDAAMAQFADERLGGRFFDTVTEFDIPCLKHILQHIVDTLRALKPNGPVTLDAFIRQPLIGAEMSSASFPQSIRTAISRLKSVMDDTDRLALQFVHSTGAWILAYLKRDELDPDIRTVLVSTLKKTLNRCQTSYIETGGSSTDGLADLLAEVFAAGYDKAVLAVLPWATKRWPSDKRLSRMGTDLQT